MSALLYSRCLSLCSSITDSDIFQAAPLSIVSTFVLLRKCKTRQLSSQWFSFLLRPAPRSSLHCPPSLSTANVVFDLKSCLIFISPLLVLGGSLCAASMNLTEWSNFQAKCDRMMASLRTTGHCLSPLYFLAQ